MSIGWLRIMNIQKLKINSNVIRLPRLSDIVPCALLFLASRGSVIGMYPFGIAMFCSVFSKPVAYLGILMLISAGFSSGLGIWIVKYILGSVLFWLYTRIKEDYRENTVMSSLISGFCLFFGGVLLMIYYPTGMYDFLVICIESLLCAFFYVVFEKASAVFIYSKTPHSEQELISAALCLGIFITGISDINLPFGINLGSLITALTVMSIALHENLAIAGCGGLAAGFICSMNSMAAVTLMGFYGICAIFGNLLSTFKKYGVALGFLGGAAVTLLYIGNSFEVPVSISEVVLSVLIFTILPEKFHSKIGRFFKRTLHNDIVPAEVRMKEYLSSRLYKASRAFHELKENFLESSEKRLKLYNKDICTVFDEVAQRVCRSCPNMGKCWGENYSDSYRIVFSILETMENQGFCSLNNAPEKFLSMCKNPQGFLIEFSHVYELYKNEVIERGRNKSCRDLLLEQYDEISFLFNEMAEEIAGGFCFLPDIEQKISEELERLQITAREISVIEAGNGSVEVYLCTNRNVNQKLISEMLSNIMKIPMGYIGKSNSSMKFTVKGAYDVEMASKQQTKTGSAINGDSLICFQSTDYKYYVILCDGMGSGKEANSESRLAATLLEEFLRAGFTPKMALNMINSALALKQDSEIFSSVDMLVIDLLSGQAEFYKIGGSKSFVWHEGQVDTVFSDTLPIGMLEQVQIYGINKRVTDGDVIIMMSDGVSEITPGFLSGDRVAKLLDKNDTDMDELSQMILNMALKKKYNRAEDDMTVVAVKVNTID